MLPLVGGTIIFLAAQIDFSVRTQVKRASEPSESFLAKERASDELQLRSATFTSRLGNFDDTRRLEPESPPYERHLPSGGRDVQRFENLPAPSQYDSWEEDERYRNDSNFDQVPQSYRYDEIPELLLPYRMSAVSQSAVSKSTGTALTSSDQRQQRPREAFVVRHKPVMPCRHCETKKLGIKY